MEASYQHMGSLPVVPVCYFHLITDLKNTIRPFDKRKPKIKISDCLTQRSRGWFIAQWFMVNRLSVVRNSLLQPIRLIIFHSSYHCWCFLLNYTTLNSRHSLSLYGKENHVDLPTQYRPHVLGDWSWPNEKTNRWVRKWDMICHRVVIAQEKACSGLCLMSTCARLIILKWAYLVWFLNYIRNRWNH